jgi:hypothetical protein
MSYSGGYFMAGGWKEYQGVPFFLYLCVIYYGSLEFDFFDLCNVIIDL